MGIWKEEVDEYYYLLFFFEHRVSIHSMRLEEVQYQRRSPLEVVSKFFDSASSWRDNERRTSDIAWKSFCTEIEYNSGIRAQYPAWPADRTEQNIEYYRHTRNNRANGPRRTNGNARGVSSHNWRISNEPQSFGTTRECASIYLSECVLQLAPCPYPLLAFAHTRCEDVSSRRRISSSRWSIAHAAKFLNTQRNRYN